MKWRINHLKGNLYFLLFTLSLFTLPATAARWQRLTVTDGLENNQTRQVISLPDGRMMAVVEGMIDLYDGERFRPLALDRTLTATVHSFLNTNHYVDAYGRLWIRTLHELAAIDVATLRPLDARRRLREAGITGRLRNFFVDADGAAWMHVGEDSLVYCDWQTEARLMLRIRELNPDSLRASVCDIVEAGGNHYILFSNGHMTCLDGATGEERYTTTVGSTSRGYYLRAAAVGEHLAIRMADKDGRRALVRYDTRHRCVTDTLLHCGIADFCVTPDDELWTCGGREIWHFDNTLRLYEHFDDAPIDLQALTPDRQGGIWACTAASGLLYRNPLARTIPYYDLSAYSAVNALHQLPDGTLLAGTARGLLRGTADGWQPVAGTETMNIVHFDADGRGGIYVSTRNRGLFLLDETLHVRWVLDEHADTKMRNNVDFCVPLKDGRSMLNTRLNRLIIVDTATGQMEHLMERMADGVQEYRRIVDMLPVEGGWIVATQNGVFALRETVRGAHTDYDIDTRRYAALSDNAWSAKCNCLFRARDGRLLVGTQNGLLAYDEATGDLQRYGTAEGLPANCIQSITDDGDGCLWVATTGGIARIDLRTEELLTLDRNDGIDDCTFTERTALRTADGHLLFGTEHGIYALTPDSVPRPALALTPQLLGIRVAGEQELFGIDHLRLSHDRNFLTFIVSALNYAYPTHTRYRYRLTGIDRDWVEVADSRGHLELAYTALPPGRYRLEVQAAMQGQPWGDALIVPVTIRPPWWQTWWAYLLYIIAALALFRYLRSSYLQRKEMRRRIDELLRERPTHDRANPSRPTPDLSRQEGESSEVREDEDDTNDDTAPAHPSLTGGDGGGSSRGGSLSPTARRFLERAIQCVDKNMGNTEYTVEAFASDMAMERSTLYRHLQNTLGQKPLEFVRTLRLKRAAELLRTGKYTITEVSELVGFNTPRYFTKHFKDMYGVRPSEYR